ncbi:hypothetical protein L345_05969, partial [Ophiophagus hannah]
MKLEISPHRKRAHRPDLTHKVLRSGPQATLETAKDWPAVPLPVKMELVQPPPHSSIFTGRRLAKQTKNKTTKGEVKHKALDEIEFDNSDIEAQLASF